MSSRAALLLACALLAAATGCKTVPKGRYAVGRVVVRGNDAVSEGDIEDKIATTQSPKFLGLMREVVYDPYIFDRFVFQRDLERVEAYYRSKGYYEAMSRAGRVHVVDDQHVDVEILVYEGKPVLTRTVRVVGTESLPEPIAAAAKRAAELALPLGRPFEEEAFERAKAAARRALADRGYAHAKAKSDAAVDLVAHAADVVIALEPGAPATFGAVTIEGLDGLPEAPVRRALDLAPGTPYSESELEAAQEAVLALGVFSSVQVVPVLEDPPPPDRVVPVRVKLEAARLRTVRFGGGLQFDALKSGVHGLASWEDRNFLGGLRRFSVSFRPGVVFYPLRVNNIEAPNKLLLEERLRVELRQPGLFEPRTNGFVRPELDVMPLLLDPNPPPDARVIGYLEGRNAVGLERQFWKLYAAVSHNLQIAYPFAYVGPRDPTLGTLVISYPELLTRLDFRDDRIKPTKGFLIGNTFQVAGGPFGGQADDVKIQPEVRGYVPLGRGFVLASRATVGFLFPQSYGDVVRDRLSIFEPSEAATRDYQLTFFRGFFSGGPTSNRGYPLRGVGPHAIVPFISPEIEAQRLATECANGDCRSPTGGFTLWEASVEVRIPIPGPLSAATFCDASDVSPRTTDIRLDHLHLSCGGGARYDTPVGPIRLDVGWRLPGLQVLGGLTPDEREPNTFLFGIPIAVNVGIGEAY